MKWMLTFIFAFILLGCSNSPNYYRPAPDTCDGAPGCAVSAVIGGVIHTKPAPKKCSEMIGGKKDKCNAQVDAIKDSIKKVQGN